MRGESFKRMFRSTALAACALAVTAAAPVGATSFSSDQSDLWYRSSESGWGMQLVQRGSVIFATLFVYDASNKPVWYTSTLVAQPDGSWAGDLYATTGPYYGAGTFDPAAVAAQKVGTMTWSSADGATGSLTYAVGGMSVTKSVERQVLVFDDFSGKYSAAISVVNSCAGVRDQFADMTVTQVGQNVSLNWINQKNQSCSFAGKLTQAGQFGKVDGTFECTPIHDDGSFTFSELVVGKYTLSGRYTSIDEDTGCTNDGWFSAARKR
jgi:hypothetical protein